MEKKRLNLHPKILQRVVKSFEETGNKAKAEKFSHIKWLFAEYKNGKAVK